MSDPIRLAWPDVGADELAAVEDVLADGRLTMGPRVAELEGLVADICECPHAVAMSSGTAAIHLALLALGLGPGDEVVVPAFTFPATANAVALVGARPVLVDVDLHTFNLDVEAVPAAITSRTRAVIGVHLFGRPLDWEALRAAVPEHVVLLEDAAGALGARYRGSPCGSLGLAGCLSFHPRKIVTTGEGGAVTTSDGDLADAVRSLRHHGIVTRGQFDIEGPGLNYRLSDVLCALGIPQLRRLEQLLERREELADRYRARLESHNEVTLPRSAASDRHGWQAYVVRVPRRDEVLATLRASGVEAQVGTYALHRLTAYRDQGPFPGAEEADRSALALPFHGRLSSEDLDRVAGTLVAALDA